MKFLSVLCQFDGEDLVSIADHLIPSIVNNMDDSDVLVSRNAWISLYQCLLNFPVS